MLILRRDTEHCSQLGFQLNTYVKKSLSPRSTTTFSNVRPWLLCIASFTFASIFGYISNDSFPVDYRPKINVCPPSKNKIIGIQKLIISLSIQLKKKNNKFMTWISGKFLISAYFRIPKGPKLTEYFTSILFSAPLTVPRSTFCMTLKTVQYFCQLFFCILQSFSGCHVDTC